MRRQPLRNIGILAHIDAGKTTLTENLLHLTGAITYPGSVDQGSATTDWQLQEQERGITIGSAAITCRWRGAEITVVDTPGHVDFTMEVERSLRVIEGCVLVVSGPDGVQAQTETVWHQAFRRRIPAIAFINKLDRDGFEPERVEEEIRDRLGIEPLPLVLTARSEGEIVLVDVIRNEARVYGIDGLVRNQRAACERRSLSAEEATARALAIERIVDAVASFDDAFAELALSGEEPPTEMFERAIRRAMSERACLPLLYGVARFGVGVELVADAIVDLLPAPDEVPLPATFDAATGQALGPGGGLADADLAAFVFKTELRPRGERLVFVRVFAGELRRGAALRRLPSRVSARPEEVVTVFAGDADPVPRLGAGMIGGLVWPRGAAAPATGETLGGDDLGATFERIDAPQPVVVVALETYDDVAHERLVELLRELAADDPSLVVGTDRETGRATLSGMGELHLELAVERAARELGMTIRTGRPTVARRRVIVASGRGRAELGEPEITRGRVAIEVAITPVPAGLGHVVRLDAPLPRRADWREALEAGLRAGLGADRGDVLAVVGVELHVIDVVVQGSDIAPVAFRDVACRAVESALAAAGPLEAEPWVSVSIVVPDPAVGRVVGDLARRGARIKGSESRAAFQVLAAEAPLEAMLGFATDLRSMSGGRGLFTMEPSSYEPVDR
ncbi:MAG: GTP-binding protein [Deltaproteobacteria bacterium]|nr:GTP-binding protein [Deltaproteobacteria bacterium]